MKPLNLRPAVPNFSVLSPEEREALTPDERERLTRIDGFRESLIAALTKTEVQAPIACADFLIVALGEAKGTLITDPESFEDGIRLGYTEHYNALGRLSNALAAFRMEHLAEIGALSQSELEKVRQSINDHVLSAQLANTKKES